MKPNNNPAEFLLQAAEVIRKRGLTKGELHDRLDGAVCLFGAFNVVATSDPNVWFKDDYAGFGYEELTAVLVDVVDGDCDRDKYGRHSHMVRWNNDEERTPEEVIAALEEAASLIASNP